MKAKQISSETMLQGAMFTLIVILAFGFVTDSFGQPYDTPSFVIAGGGGESTSAGYAVNGTIGQPIVDVSASANYIVGAGFWGGLVQTFRVSIDAIWWSAGQGVRVAWHSVGGATYVVHFADTLSGTWKAIATLAGTGAIMEWLDDGTQTGLSPTAASVIKRFYKLSGQP